MTFKICICILKDRGLTESFEKKDIAKENTELFTQGTVNANPYPKAAP